VNYSGTLHRTLYWTSQGLHIDIVRTLHAHSQGRGKRGWMREGEEERRRGGGGKECEEEEGRGVKKGEGVGSRWVEGVERGAKLKNTFQNE
jgi:hypothetical protein